MNRIDVEEDGLCCPEVGSWSEIKYSLVGLYASLFSSGMKNKWKKRCYIDLYAGAGYSRVRGTTRILAASPILALTVENPFDKYILCEENEEKMAALKARVERHRPDADVTYILGKCDDNVAQILRCIPHHTSENTVLSLCFVDPFDIGLKFETLRLLSSRFVDFLVLLAVYMDANRNFSNYFAEHSTKVSDFLGNRIWRQNWAQAQVQRKSFPTFLAEEFASSMEAIAYVKQPIYKMKVVRKDENNSPLYYLALFSRHKVAYSFWTEVLKYSNPQLSMFEE